MKKASLALILAAALAATGYYLYQANPQEAQQVEANLNEIVEDASTAATEIVAEVEAGGQELLDNMPEAQDDIQNAVEEVSENISEAVENITTSNASFDLNHALSLRSLGNPNAPIKLTEYASLTCGHCADFHLNTYPEFKEKYIDTGKVYFTFNDFPLNAPALDGAMIARCLPEERYFQYLSFLFKSQEDWAADANYQLKLRQNAKLLGASDQLLHDCLASEELREGLVERMQVASQTFEVSSTPSFVVNEGEDIIRGAQSFEALSAYLDNLLARQ